MVEPSEGHVRILKPHGSINFFSHPDHQFHYGEPPPDEDRGLPTKYSWDENENPTPNYPIVYAAMHGAENVLANAALGRIPSPVIANYTAGKRADVNDQTLSEVRKRALEYAKLADKIVIIGVKPIRDADDDPFVANLFSDSFRDVTYVSKGESDCAALTEIYGHATLFKDGLLEYLDQVS